MARFRRYLIEIGMGVDQHGQDPTKAAVRAAQDAVTRVCMVGLRDLISVERREQIRVEALVACPEPRRVNRAAVAKVFPVGQPTVRVARGGMAVPGTGQERIYVATVAVTVSVDLSTGLLSR